MKSALLVPLFLIYGNIVFSQKQIFSLHPAVGDTISLQEKKDYLILDEIPDTSYTFGIIYKDTHIFMLHSNHNARTQAIAIDSSRIAEYRSNIEKLHAYYSQSADSVEYKNNLMKVSSQPTQAGKGAVMMNAEEKEKLARESRRHSQLSNMADEKGLKGQNRTNYINSGGYSEIQFKKKK